MGKSAEQAYLDAAVEYAAARVRFAEQFARARLALGDRATDGQATQHAIAATGDEVTVLAAKLAIAANRALDPWAL